MKAASVQEIKQQLTGKSVAQLTDLCLRLARYKKENKELLTYLLFEANDLEGYIKSVKEEIDECFTEINSSHLYYAKKSLRKILRTANKYIRYSGSKIAETELLLYYCQKINDSEIKIKKSTALTNLYNGQTKKLQAAINSLHEDLQYDYLRQLENLKD